MTAGEAILFIAAFTGIGLLGAGFFVMHKIRQISEECFGTPSLIEGLKRQEMLEDEEEAAREETDEKNAAQTKK